MRKRLLKIVLCLLCLPLLYIELIWYSVRWFVKGNEFGDPTILRVIDFKL